MAICMTSPIKCKRSSNQAALAQELHTFSMWAVQAPSEPSNSNLGYNAICPRSLNQLMPPGTHYGHEQAWHDGNAHSHLQATTLGPSILVPVGNGRLVLGTWQQIFHLECDNKPRSREIVVTVMGD